MNALHPPLGVALVDAVPPLPMAPAAADAVPLFTMSPLPGGGPGGGGGRNRVLPAPAASVPKVEAKPVRSVPSCFRSCDRVLAVVPVLLTDDGSLSVAEVPVVAVPLADDEVPPIPDSSDCRSARIVDIADVLPDAAAPVLAAADEPPVLANMRAKFIASGAEVSPVTAPWPKPADAADAAYAELLLPFWLDCATGGVWYAASCAQRSFCPDIELNTIQSPLIDITVS
jgi:hypothetical protein